MPREGQLPGAQLCTLAVGHRGNVHMGCMGRDHGLLGAPGTTGATLLWGLALWAGTVRPVIPHQAGMLTPDVLANVCRLGKAEVQNPSQRSWLS